MYGGFPRYLRAVLAIFRLVAGNGASLPRMYLLRHVLLDFFSFLQDGQKMRLNLHSLGSIFGSVRSE